MPHEAPVCQNHMTDCICVPLLVIVQYQSVWQLGVLWKS